MASVEKQLLGGLTVPAFLRRHWQKQPLLVHGAVPGFDGIVDFDRMVDLACREECESRLILRRADRWTVEHGPFERKRFSRLPPRDWTLLVQGLEQVLPAARALLLQFNFIPYSRLDDLMVSFAPAGGGVGAHFDSYDVFLLQGPGQRLWRVGRQRDRALIDNLPLKILRHFSPDGQCVLGAGDMLYLPPAYAHEGVATQPCYTYSIGFRAPSHRELMSEFLIFLDDRLAEGGRYGDPELSMQTHPAHLGAGMIRKVERIVGKISWTRRDVAEFLGAYLTEPKPRVQFAPVRRPLSERAFTNAATQCGVALVPAALMLYGSGMVFINGETHRITDAQATPLRRLADARRLAGRHIPRSGPILPMLYHWYRDGYIYLTKSDAAA